MSTYIYNIQVVYLCKIRSIQGVKKAKVHKDKKSCVCPRSRKKRRLRKSPSLCNFCLCYLGIPRHTFLWSSKFSMASYLCSIRAICCTISLWNLSFLWHYISLKSELLVASSKVNGWDLEAYIWGGLEADLCDIVKVLKQTWRMFLWTDLWQILSVEGWLSAWKIVVKVRT